MSDKKFTYKALEAKLENGKLTTDVVDKDLYVTDALDQVLVEVHYSSLNFKDALGVTGKGKIFKTLPITPGIDASGIVKFSSSSKFQVGDKVLVTGCGIGESADGGFAELLFTRAENVIKLSDKLTLFEAMIYGTAGFTAALCIERLEANAQTPDKGPMLVTGASGGVGSFALAFLTSLGFDVIAMSGKTEATKFLYQLGAKEVVSPEDFDPGTRPLETARFGGGIDNVGGCFLEGMIRQTALWGNIAAVGLAADHKFSSSVMPFILRGVSLLGISSTNCPLNIRHRIWQRLAHDLKPRDLNTFVSRNISLHQISEAAEDMIARKTSGRIVVKVQ